MLKFAVKNLGRITSAEVTVAPLLILVGKNNTGKSYLATLLWALGELGSLPDQRIVTRKPKWFTDFVAPMDKPASRRLVLDRAKITAAVGIVQRILSRTGSEYLSKVFAYSGFQDTKVKIFPADVEEIELVLEVHGPVLPNEDADESRVLFTVRINDEKQTVFRIRTEWFATNTNWLHDVLFYQVIGYCLYGLSWQAYRRQIYIPAARTGIMLGLPALAAQALGSNDDEQRMLLPRPLAAFLSRMTSRAATRATSGGDAPVRDRLRRELLHGQIAAAKEGVADFRYTPEGAEIALPLYATSSMITELAPFLVSLENRPGTTHFIFEEPEAHLHLEAQREMARLIARLVSGGTPVTLTTHSDTFLQQINNLMVLADHPEREQKMEELGYEPSDLIDPDFVRAYEFVPNENGTEVHEVERSRDGFIVATLNKTLLALAEETMSLRSGRDG